MMLILDNVSEQINTALLLVIFFYQRNRNKILLDRVEQQEKLIGETKTIIEKQSTAIDSQSKVVDTAMKYTESFSAEKLESIIRREMDIENQKKIEEVKLEYKQGHISIEQLEKSLTVLSEELIERLSGYTIEMVIPVYENLFRCVMELPVSERIKFIDTVENMAVKEYLEKFVVQVNELTCETSITNPSGGS